jgi:hypothetical protein
MQQRKKNKTNKSRKGVGLRKPKEGSNTGQEEIKQYKQKGGYMKDLLKTHPSNEVPVDNCCRD